MIIFIIWFIILVALIVNLARRVDGTALIFFFVYLVVSIFWLVATDKEKLNDYKQLCNDRGGYTIYTRSREYCVDKNIIIEVN